MRIRILVSLCLVVALLCSCATPTLVEHENYKIYKEDGKWYLELPPDKYEQYWNDWQEEYTSEDAYIHYAAPIPPMFNTFSEMQEKIVSGDIPFERLAALWEMIKDNDVLETLNPYDLQNVKAPKELECTSILWYGDRYGFSFTGKEISGNVHYCTKEIYEEKYDAEMENWEQSWFTIISDTKVRKRNARVVCYTTGSAELKSVFYTVKSKYGETLHIKEEYTLSSSNGTGTDTIPTSIEIFGEGRNTYFYSRFRGFQERPSVEWLQSFGLVS